MSIPRDHQSTANSWPSPRTTSGETYSSVPTNELERSPLEKLSFRLLTGLTRADLAFLRALVVAFLRFPSRGGRGIQREKLRRCLRRGSLTFGLGTGIEGRWGLGLRVSLRERSKSVRVT